MHAASRRPWPVPLDANDLLGAEFYGPDMVSIRARLLQSLNNCWHVRAMTGFFTGWSGDEELLAALKAALARPKKIGKSMIVVDPFGGPACVKALSDVLTGLPDPDARVRVHATRIAGGGDPTSRVLMHSKLWLFRMPDHAEVWVGSANATGIAVKGLNVESTCVLRLRPESVAYRSLVAQVQGFYRPGDRTPNDLQSTLPVTDDLLSFIGQNLVRHPAWEAKLSEGTERREWMNTTVFLYRKSGSLPLTVMLKIGEGEVLQLERQAYAREGTRLATALAAQGSGQYWAPLSQDRLAPVLLQRCAPPQNHGHVGEYTVQSVRRRDQPRMRWVDMSPVPAGLPKGLAFQKLVAASPSPSDRRFVYVAPTV